MGLPHKVSYAARCRYCYGVCVFSSMVVRTSDFGDCSFGSVTEAQLAIVVHNSCHVKSKSIRSITKANARINFQKLSSYSKSSHQISNTHTKFKSLYGQSSQIIWCWTILFSWAFLMIDVGHRTLGNNEIYTSPTTKQLWGNVARMSVPSHSLLY